MAIMPNCLQHGSGCHCGLHARGTRGGDEALGLWVESPQYCLWSVPAKVIDQRLGTILVPDVINPLPRGVSDRKHWKGHF